LNLKKATMITSIAIGAFASSIFWTLAFKGVVSFLPSPWILYAILAGATFGLLAYKKIRERRLYRELHRKILRLRAHREIRRRKSTRQLERYVKELKEKGGKVRS
jgi:type II secretory pathway component PulF